MKAYTDLEQSEKLAEFLPHESADMVLLHEEPYETSDSKFDGLHQALCVSFKNYGTSWRQKYRNISYYPCWSLASLLNVLESEIYGEEGESYKLNIEKDGVWWDVWYESQYDEANPIETKSTKELIDACYELILKLHKLQML